MTNEFSLHWITPTERNSNSTEKIKVFSQRPILLFLLLWLPFLSVKLNNKGPGEGKLFVRLGRQKEQWNKLIISYETVYDSSALQ